ncbi:MAG TPA: MMPL family transporter [Thermodesulfobacteriota bacterium]|nr:MMPL family transporter [Thermodesulfobacteriota bacterium]
MVGELFTGFLEEPKPKGEEEPLDLEFLVRTLAEMKKSLERGSVFASPWNSLFTKSSRDESEEGYFWTQDKKYLLLFVTPTKKDDFAGTLHSLQALRQEVLALKAQFPDVQAGVTGPEALNVDQMGTALQDMSIATLLSIGAVAVLLALFWRGIRRPFMEMIRLIIDLCLTIGATTLFVGHLNILSVTFAPLLLGLGIDYGAHWVARYMEEERKGFSQKTEALRSIMEKLAPGLLLAGITAGFSFLPLVLTGFKGLMELGLICAMGMGITTLTSISLLPALIMLLDKPKLRPQSSVPVTTIRPFMLFTPRRSTLLLILGLVGFAFSIWGATKVRFDLNMLHLQSPKVESVIWEKKLLEGSGISSIYGEVLAHSLEEVRQKTGALKTLPGVSRVESIDTLLPANQEEKLAFLRQMKPDLGHIRFVAKPRQPVDIGELEAILGRIRFKMVDEKDSRWGIHKPLAVQMTEVRNLIDAIRRRLSSLKPAQAQRALQRFEGEVFADLREKLDLLQANINARPAGIQDLPPSLRERFMSRDNLFLIRVFPHKEIWDPAILGDFVRQIRSVDEDAIGDPVTLYVFTQAFRDGCIKATIYAVAFIFILLLLTFRDFRSTFLSLVPFVIGTGWTLGLMYLFGVDLNLANSIFLPLVVGAALEYGIIILHRWRQSENHDPSTILPFSTAMGVLLAGATTTVGFGSLCISSHHGIFSLGLLTTVGSVAILAAALFFLPSLLAVLNHRNPKK